MPNFSLNFFAIYYFTTLLLKSMGNFLLTVSLLIFWFPERPELKRGRDEGVSLMSPVSDVYFY